MICGQPLQVFSEPGIQVCCNAYRHVACPVPGGILKAIEVGSASVSKSVNMDFIREEGRDDSAFYRVA